MRKVLEEYPFPYLMVGGNGVPNNFNLKHMWKFFFDKGVFNVIKGIGNVKYNLYLVLGGPNRRTSLNVAKS